jgi:hypothetical protein
MRRMLLSQIHCALFESFSTITEKLCLTEEFFDYNGKTSPHDPFGSGALPGRGPPSAGQRLLR